MLIKPAGDAGESIAALETRAAKAGPGHRGAASNLARRKAGVQGEAQSAYFIDFDFAGSPNWAVLHDLRLVHGDRTAQIDHLLINRWMEFFVLETKHFATGIKINEDGEFLTLGRRGHGDRGIASPLQQNERHIAVLADVLGTIELPHRLGVRIAPSFHSLVLVAPTARIVRPQRFDTSRVIKADQLKPRIWREIDDPNPVTFLLKSAARLVSAETVQVVGERLAALHSPARGKTTPAAAPPAKPASAAPAAKPSSAAAVEVAACKHCKGTAGEIQYGRYGYYFRCDACSANTAIRFSCKPGHAPRLRKQGNDFHRDCPECGTSRLYHRNAGAPTA